MGQVDITPALRVAVRRTQAVAKELAPVDTGFLRASIFTLVYPNAKYAKVYTNTEYAIYQEFGTVHMKAQPFMRPAFNQTKKHNLKDIENYLKSAVKRSVA